MSRSARIGVVAVALVAVGGYGRGELFPYSDIDILVLIEAEPTPREKKKLEALIGLFWDAGLEVGHSVRTIEGCLLAASGDITVQTSLLEARLVCGNRELFQTPAVKDVATQLSARTTLRMWTDDYSNLFRILK